MRNYDGHLKNVLLRCIGAWFSMPWLIIREQTVIRLAMVADCEVKR